MAMPDKLTTKEIDAEPAPPKGTKTLWDSEIKGFGVRIFAPTTKHPLGARSFFLNYRVDGKERRYTIGDRSAGNRSAWSVEAARIEAKELRRRIDRGENPALDKRERRGAPTVQDLIDRYVADHLPKKSSEAMRVADEKKMLEEIGKHLGKHTKVVDIHGGDIADMHRKISESIGRYGPRRVRANRVLAVCSKMFALALIPMAGETLPWRDAVAGNPCKGIEKNQEEARSHYFKKSELERIAGALQSYPGVGADCIRLIMLTGCRPGEAMKAEWPEFDTEPGYWIKPSAHVKQRKTHRLPLSPPANELIERLRKTRTGSLVFPGDIAGEPLKTLFHVWEHVREHAQLEEDEKGRAARPYDLRHTFASVAVGGGFNLPIIGKLLGHTQTRTTQRYAHIDDDPLREAANKVGTVIDGKPGAEIVPMPQGVANKRRRQRSREGADVLKPARWQR
jgi:integrase